MAKRTPKTGTALASIQDEIPTVRPQSSGWHKRELPSSAGLRPGTTDGLWQLVCDVMRAEADEALRGTGR
ncbi:MAG TPA: hypothetical protein VFV94_03710 [Polyangiaceae bacterium]|nr:hypothetical protein [Polyangiaceae bacterium]